MTTRFAVLFCLGSLGITASLAGAEHKAEPAKKESHGEAKKPEAKHDAKPAAKPETKPEAKHEPAPPEAKPSAMAEHAAPRAPIARRAPVRPPARATARAAATPKPAAVKPAPTAAPIIVQVSQEPARVEAVLHVVPYGAQAPGVAPFAGAGYTTAPSYTVAAYPVAAPAETHDAHAEPAAAPAAYAAPPVRNTLRTPKNALTNEGLVMLAQVGYDEDFILDLMRLKNCRFDTSVEGLAYMATHGLTERIVKAALKADAENQLAASLEARR